MALSPCGALVRAGDPVRFRHALFAPPAQREGLFALYAFNLELAKIAPMVSEPMLGEIRLQWWREAVEAAYDEGAVRAHEVVQPLTAAIRERALPRELLDRMIDARAADLDPAFPPDEATLDLYLADTAGALTRLAALVLADLDEEGVGVVTRVGKVIGTARYLDAAPMMREHGARWLPTEVPRGASNRDPEFIEAIRARVTASRAMLREARAKRRSIPRTAAPALLEARLADRALRRRVRQPMAAAREPRLTAAEILRGLTGRW